MPKLIVTRRDGTVHEVDGDSGSNVMEVIRDHGFDELLAMSGGSCSCVYVDGHDLARLSAVGLEEKDLHDSSDYRAAGSRLSCQIPFGEDLDGLRIMLAPED